MITFRFYLVTLVAIFLSVALGVTIGSTFLEPALVQDLNNQVDSVQQNLDERVARIDELEGHIDDLDTYVDESAPYSVEGRLDGATVLVAAAEGTDGEDVERLIGRIRQAGGTAEGIVWLQPGFGSSDDAAAVLGELGLDAPASGAEVAETVWAEVLAAGVVPEVDSGGEGTTTTTEAPDGSTTSVPGDETTTTAAPTTTTTTAPPTIPPLFGADALQVLDDVGWLRLQEIEAGEPLAPPSVDVPPRFAVVLVTASDLDEDAFDVVQLARQQATAGIATTVAEVWADEDEGASRGAALQPIRDDAELSELVSTVDDLDLVQGQVAVVLAVADLGAGVVGQYGYGPGAELVVPEWSGP